MESLLRKEKVMLDKHNQGKLFLYDVYLYAFKNIEMVKVVEGKLLDLCKTKRYLHSFFYDDNGILRVEYQYYYSPLFLRDLSKMDDEEKNNTYNSIIYAEQRRRYYPDKNFLMEMYAIKLSEEKYIFVLSICNQADMVTDLERIIKETFSNTNLITVGQSLAKINTNTVGSASFWRGRLTPAPQPLKKLENINKGVFRIESFSCGKEIAGILKKSSNGDDNILKMQFLALWGYISCKFFGTETMILGDSIDDSKLRYMPIRFHSNLDFNENVRNMCTQAAEGKQYEGITVTRLEEMMGFVTKNCVPIIQKMADRKKSNINFSDMRDGIVYHLLPRKYSECALNIDFYNLGQEFIINYIYNTAVLDDENVSSLHNTFVSMVENLLPGISAGNEALEQENGNPLKNKRLDVRTHNLLNSTDMHMEKAEMLIKSGLMMNYNKSDLMIIAKKCSIGTYMQDDLILGIASMTKSTYIVLEGNVVANGLGHDNILLPLFTIKEGEVFGVEATLEKNINKIAYVAATEYVKLLEIPGILINGLINKNPMILRKLLEIQTERLYKFERLWIME